MFVSPVVFDFSNNSISVPWQQKSVNLKQGAFNPKVKVLHEAKGSNVVNKEDVCYLIQVMAVNESSITEVIPEEISTIVTEYQDVFVEPKGLPQ